MPSARAESSLRAKNQITVPDAIVKQLGLQQGDRFVFEVEEGEGIIRLYRLRDSYAGALAGVYGNTDEEIAEYLSDEREAWGE